MDRHLTTTADVIEALGGIEAVAKSTGRTYTAVSNWRVWNRFPPRTFLLLSDALREKGLTVSVLLWGFDEPHSIKRDSSEISGDAA